MVVVGCTNLPHTSVEFTFLLVFLSIKSLTQYIILRLFQLGLQMAAVVGDFLVHPTIDTYADDESQILFSTINEVYICIY